MSWQYLLLSFALFSFASGHFETLKSIHHNFPPKSRIIGGDEVVPHSVPFQVGLRINGNSFCGGALISPNFVITAGHCGIVIRSVDVILGAHNISDPSEASQVVIKGSKIIVHEQYNNDNLHNDISLIQLERSAPINDVIKTIKLPTKWDTGNDYLNQVATASGWGLPKDVPWPSLDDMSDVLLKVDVAVSSLTDCEEYYNDNEDSYVLQSNICTTGYKNKGTCNGDSGGPLALNGVLIGLTSFGTDQCEWCAPSVYTRVDYYLNWIATNSDVKL